MNVQQMIELKNNEIGQRQADLRCPEYPSKDWAQKQIEYLLLEIDLIKKGEILSLPRCSQYHDAICPLAHTIENKCLLKTMICDFRYRPQVKQSVLTI